MYQHMLINCKAVQWKVSRKSLWLRFFFNSITSGIVLARKITLRLSFRHFRTYRERISKVDVTGGLSDVCNGRGFSRYDDSLMNVVVQVKTRCAKRDSNRNQIESICSLCHETDSCH